MVDAYLKRFAVSILFSVCAIYCTAQDVHFSQFYLQPLMISPAKSGDYPGDMRYTAVHRRQWGQLGTPILTSGASVEGKIYVYPNFLSVGVQFLNDQVTAQNFKTNSIQGSAAYHIQTKLGKLSYGLSFGWVNRSLDLSGLSFPSQYNSSTGRYNTSIASGEPNLSDRETYLDIGAGVLLTNIVAHHFRFKSAFSVAHLNSPQYGFSQEKYRLPLLATYFQSVEIRLVNHFIFIPMVQVMRSNKATNIVTVMQLEKEFAKNIALFAGLGYRGYGVQNDAMIATFGYTLPHMDIGISYDFNISKLSEDTSTKSAIEIAISYRTTQTHTHPGKAHKRRSHCVVF